MFVLGSMRPAKFQALFYNNFTLKKKSSYYFCSTYVVFVIYILFIELACFMRFEVPAKNTSSLQKKNIILLHTYYKIECKTNHLKYIDQTDGSAFNQDAQFFCFFFHAGRGSN